LKIENKMKKQNKYLISSILIIGFFCFMNESIGQVKVLNIPEKFMVPLENVKLEKSSKTYKKAWLVFSDRDDNPAYATPELGSVKNTARFMESFYVIDESGSYLQLARGGTLDPATGTIKNHEEFGWMPKDNLLLWAHCMVTEKSEIPKKVMILNTVEYTKENPSESEMNVLRFHKKPNLTVPSGIESRLFEVFFIYKKSTDGRSYLLGRSSKIGGLTNPENYIVGWAPRTRLNFWDHRIAIEPNWIRNDANNRKNHGIKALIFKDSLSAMKYKLGLPFDSNQVVWDSDPFEKRLSGEVMRFPYISSKNGIIKVLFIKSSESPSINKSNQRNEDKSRNTNTPEPIIYGFTANYVKGCSSPLFQNVLFLTQEEFATMVADLRELSKYGSTNDSRRAMYNAWLEILKDHIGRGISEEELSSWSFEKITETVFGLPSQSEFIKNVRLQDITDPSRMQDRDFIAWQSKIERQAETLKKIINDDYPYSFRSNDEVYYWIAQSQLP
jgi:hypothetical protein